MSNIFDIHKAVWDLNLIIMIILSAYGLGFYRTCHIPLKIFIVLLCTSSCVALMSSQLGRVGVSNLFLFHFYAIVEFILFSWLYKLLFYRYCLSNNFFYLFIFTIVMILLINSLYIQPIDTFNSYSKSLVNFIFFIYALLFLLQTFKEKDTTEGTHYWHPFNITILIYTAAGFMIYLFSDYMLRAVATDTQLLMWTIFAGFTVLYHCAILYFLIQYVRRKKQGADGIHRVV